MDYIKSATDKATYSTMETVGPRPLTNQISGDASEQMDLARQIAARLYELRDRLFGSQPASGPHGLSASTSPPAASFSDVYSGMSREMFSILSNIDQLSRDLSNQL